MATHKPAVMKKLGREVRGFDALVWERHCEDIVFRVRHLRSAHPWQHERGREIMTRSQGNLAKFSASRELCDLLLATGNKVHSTTAMRGPALSV
jgi:predicted NAD-dependent protein-ADP-ribosyltransferase YbiA (DUF1768 family)